MFDNSLANNSSKSSSNPTTFKDNKGSDNTFNYKNAIKENSHLTDTINIQNNYDNYDKKVIQSMQSQLTNSDTLNGK